ncbi:FAD/NAD(P)-binding domain-containing protein [Cystobasidium minutum MCA 4210]|uniref:FAD/NAD(P)-binding domain-containing protein n=1 Tax=Cystobasidium minutum MCA 4210 TaxID=1397322 RepID=UPI0034CF552A|eukprot:jgi/Rhomi1/195539/gm1.3753_g
MSTQTGPGINGPAPPIAVIGAGIGGLTLARLLELKNIQVAVYESKSQERFAANHGLWLGAQTCQDLLSHLQVPFEDFRKKTAVTAELSDLPKDAPISGIRVNKRRLLEYLLAGIDVKWEHQLKEVQASDSGLKCTFKEEKSIQVTTLIGADGVHSAVRSAVLPNIKPKVLPYIAINGQRRTSLEEYQKEHSAEEYTDSVSHRNDRNGAQLSAGLNDIKRGTAYHFWTYSRPAKEGEDPLFKPDRSTAEANAIPAEFFDEVEASSFSDQVNREKTKEDRLLSWLLRSIELQEGDLERLPKGVVVIGDAAHGTPILGGDGAEQAIQDAIALSKVIGEASDKEMDVKLREFSKAALLRWKESVKDSISRLEQMHRAPVQL